MTNEELLKLYMADQAERRRLLQTKDKREVASMKEIILINDAKRRELAADLMPEATSYTKSDVLDYFHAAVIFSRGNSKSDRERAHGYAKKAYVITRFQHSDFSEEVQNLHAHTESKLHNKDHDASTEEKNHASFSLKPKGPQEKNKEAEEKDREEKLKLRSRCFVCGKQHMGPCPPTK